MIRALPFIIGCLLSPLAWCQETPFEFGAVPITDLLMTQYNKDTTASAVFLREFGKAYVDAEQPHDIVLEYHCLIKILRPEGVSQSNWDITLHNRHEELLSVKAATYNLDQGAVKATEVDPKNLLSVRINNYQTSKRLAFPDVHVGSVLELEYTLKTPFYVTFRRWQFQDRIPKIHSEYWASIPGQYVYDITLRGFLKLSRSDVSVDQGCWQDADCNLYKFAMENVPAFVQEDQMTTPVNFMSAIRFELTAVKYGGGGSIKFTKTWRDAQNLLRYDEFFGVQLKKGNDILKDISPPLETLSDSLAKARVVYDFIKNHIKWDEYEMIFSEQGIRKAYDNATGSVGDVNLSLIAALRASGLNAIPVILSTRDNGIPYEGSPQLTDYNYVIALLHVGGHDYLLDATDRELPFGMIPERCLNGKGRALSDDASYWYPLSPNTPSREFHGMELSFDDDGELVGTVTSRYTGYAAFDKRKELDGYSSTDDYVRNLETQFPKATITNYTISQRDSLDKPLVETFQISMSEAEDMGSPVVLFNPFLMGQIKANPFKLNSRQYPVDFGTTPEQTFNIGIQLPKGYEAVNLPEPVKLVLPGNAAHFGLNTQVIGNTLRVYYLLSISQPVFAPNEYENLKEFYSRIVQTEATDVVLKAVGN